jgi:hypothetical protein
MLHYWKTESTHGVRTAIEIDQSGNGPRLLRLTFHEADSGHVVSRLFVFILVLCCPPLLSAERVRTETVNPETVSDKTVNSTLNAQARQLAERFVGELKPQLKQAMLEGGPTLAIEVCASLAPGIADNLAEESGWLVERVSLKSRNAVRGLPDSWERAVLVQFDQQQAAGQPASTLIHDAVEGNTYRYMQAQVVEPLCLNCHGTNIAKPVRAVLNEFYPEDAATGYLVGQVRGAISLATELPVPQAESLGSSSADQ